MNDKEATIRESKQRYVGAESSCCREENEIAWIKSQFSTADMMDISGAGFDKIQGPMGKFLF